MDPKRRGNYPWVTAKEEWAMGNAKPEFNWRVARGFALAACLAGGCVVVGSPAKAEATSASENSGLNFRLLSAKEGRAIVDAARDEDQAVRGAQDCSHVVHEIYLRA